jgi:hypothetical protein
MGLTSKKYIVSVSFCGKLTIFAKNHRLTHTDFERKFDFFKTRKYSYTRPLYVTNPEYGAHDQEIRSFGQFLSQTDDFR